MFLKVCAYVCIHVCMYGCMYFHIYVSNLDMSGGLRGEVGCEWNSLRQQFGCEFASTRRRPYSKGQHTYQEYICIYTFAFV